MSDRFDSIMGPGRGDGDSTPRPEIEAFSVRVRRLGEHIARRGARLHLVEQTAALNDLSVVSGWLVGKESQAPLFLVSDNRRPAGRQPDALLLAWLADGIDGRTDADEDLVDHVVLFTYDSEVARP